ncbi:unnamed protein product [Meloidogyne enterolobii]|uniref:Uncharacterized protein n=1 Tax=Meloidogyne enterolobii TaxID=390850 RepID=A0ACB0XPX3_MELEN
MIDYNYVFKYVEDYEIFNSEYLCYEEEKYFEKYCDLDKMSKPINATFDEYDLFKIVIFVDEIVDNNGATIINIGKNTEFLLLNGGEAMSGSSKNVEKIAKVLNAQIDKETNKYYLNGNCKNIRSEGTPTIGVKFKDSNTTINVSGRDMADFSVSIYLYL